MLKAGIDLIEFSMDAGDPDTYAIVRPPHRGAPRDPQQWWDNHVGNVRAALAMRKEFRTTNRIVVSMIRQDIMEGKMDAAVKFWMEDVGVDEVITRKFLSWDDNTTIPLGHALDPHLYKTMPTEQKEPCVWPFERMNVDTLGRVALCGQDISFKTATLFPNVNDATLKEIWQGERFNWYRRLHLEGQRRRGVALPRLLGLARRHPRLGVRLAEGAQALGRSRAGSDEAGPRRRRRGLSAAVTTSQARAGEGPVPGGVAYFGYGELGVAGLRTLISLGARVVAVMIPGNRSGPGVDKVREAAGQYAVPLLVQPPRSSVEPFAGVLRNLSPDLILMWSYSMLLPPPVLTIPAKGAVNVHGGLLP